MNNCLFYALSMWWRHGGFVVGSTSPNGWWKHFMWTPDFETFYAFTPDYPRRYWLPPVWFRGSIKTRTRAVMLRKFQ